MKVIDTEYLVLGAGFTGLAAAEIISGQGKDAVVLEQDGRAGGLAKTVEHEGFKFDLGGHRIYFDNNRTFGYLKNVLKPRELCSHKRKSSIYLGGKFLNYPPGVSDCLKHRFSDTAKFIFEVFAPGRKDGNESLQDWIFSRFGSTIHDLYFRDYSQKVWGLQTSAISADWAEKRIGNFDGGKFIKGVFTGSARIKENASVFYYPEGGIGDVCDGLSGRVRERAKIYLNSSISSLIAQDKRLSGLIFTAEQEEYKVNFRYLISTIPLLSLCRLIFPAAVSRGVVLSKKIKYRSLILAYIILNRDKVFNEHWVYFPDKDTVFSRVSEPKNWSSCMAPAGRTSLCCEIFCDHGDEWWRLDDKSIMERVRVSLVANGFIDRADVSDYCVLRIEYAYPLLYRGYKTDLDPVLNDLSGYANLVLAGRSGTHSYFDMEECLNDAFKKVEPILES